MLSPALLSSWMLLQAPVVTTPAPAPDAPVQPTSTPDLVVVPAPAPPAAPPPAAPDVKVPAQPPAPSPAADVAGDAAKVQAPAPEQEDDRDPDDDQEQVWRGHAAGGPQLFADPSNPDAAACRATAALCAGNDDIAFWPRMRLRTGYQFVQPDAALALVGRNDGFFMDQARVGFDAQYRQMFRFRAILELASFLPGGGANQPVQAVLGAARDIWVSYIPSRWASITVGQQFVPSDVEGSTTLATLPFISRSLLSSGVRAGQGYAVAGLSPPRQLGVVVQSTDGARIGDISLEYGAGIGNGNGQNVSGNDNKLPAAYARAGAGYRDIVQVAVGGRYNPRTVGSAPDLFNESDALGFADVSLHVMGVEAVVVGQFRQTNFATLSPDPASPAGSENAFGVTGWVALSEPFGVDLFGITPAYRISYYDPSNRFADDQALENTLAIRWAAPVPHLSVAVIAEGTLLTELGDGVRDLDNARAALMVQLDL
jgi:hypothetical protein